MLYRTLIKWLAPVGLALILSGCSPAPKVQSISGQTMGTSYHISWVAGSEGHSPEQLQAAIDQRLEQVNDSMSNWRPDSLISQFNDLRSDEAMLVDADFIAVMRESVRLAELTDGALDVTISPVVDLWGFGPQGRVQHAPSIESIQEAKAHTGIKHLEIEGMRLRKHLPTLNLNLGAIAKGYGVDVVADLLDEQGIHDYLVEIGGELRLKGAKPDQQPWRIAIEKPDAYGRGVAQILAPGEMAIATSGDYRNFFEEEGRRFSHLIDPRSGEPVNTRLASATVLAPTAMTADALATAFIIMGTESSLALAEREELPVMLIEKRPDGEYEVFYSTAFEPYMEVSQR
ncbi:FAD:protein FMN transferase [Ferrimonas marina]|uniref:FAD:protein FMN transferase n=1 Tax=Ferrimonas marina TaxID=299255 RepID=A0A1M5YHD6_9GAMM|nr:FAD:protein FMN transferase [Ferrimonas marina]SHI11298.1 thiamine biosynthesis lipoprotein [Ferrimonas marina]